jgi:hypothetical protein
MNEATLNDLLAELYRHLLNAARSLAEDSVRRLQELSDRYPESVLTEALDQLQVAESPPAGPVPVPSELSHNSCEA